LNFLNLYNILFGSILLGLLFGFFFQLFLRSFLSTFNYKYKKQGGKDALRYSVENGLIYLIPYAIIMTLATFVLSWGMSLGFVSTGIMTVGATATMELRKNQR
jgi:small-conductance mechanosensitive channel